MPKRKIRIRLKDILQERDMAQAELSRLSGVREEVISRMVNNKYERIQLEHLECIMRILEVDFNEFFEMVWEEEDS